MESFTIFWLSLLRFQIESEEEEEGVLSSSFIPTRKKTF